MSPAVGRGERLRALLRDPVSWAVIVAALVAAGLRGYYLIRPGHLLGLTEYDDGPYFGSAVRLTQGILPYRDFVLVQPPGITLLMLPAALLAKVTGTAWGLAVGRILTAAAGTACVVLMGLLVRHRGFLATAIACGVVACFPDSVAAAHTVLVEPWLVLFCLLGAVLLFDGDQLTRGRRLVWAGVSFGFAGAVEGWAIVPVAVLTGLCLAHPVAGGSRLSRAGRFAAGVAAGFCVPVVPFAAAAPGGFFRSLVVAQLGPRAGATRIPVLDRLQDLAGLSNVTMPTSGATGYINPGLPVDISVFGAHIQVGTALLVWGVAVLLAVAVIGLPALLNFLTRVTPSPLEWFVLAATELVIAMFLWPDQFHYHFAAFVAPFLGLGIGLPLATVVRVVAQRSAAPGAAEVAEGRPAPSRAAWLGRRLPAVVTVAALGVLALFTVLEVRAESISYQIVGPPQISATARRIPPGACVLSDNASLLLLANRFVSDVKGCAVIDDGLGTDLALSHGLTPFTGAGRVPAVAEVWMQAFSRARYVWFTNHSYRRIPFVFDSSLRDYFYRDFKPIKTDSLGDMLYERTRPGS